MAKIRKGDEIVVLVGKDKGKRGTVLSIGVDDRVVVEGVNLAKKHVRPNPAKGIVGGIVNKTMPLHISNVALFDSKTGKPSRVGYKLEDGKKIRILRSTGLPVAA